MAFDFHAYARAMGGNSESPDIKASTDSRLQNTRTIGEPVTAPNGAGSADLAAFWTRYSALESEDDSTEHDAEDEDTGPAALKLVTPLENEARASDSAILAKEAASSHNRVNRSAGTILRVLSTNSLSTADGDQMRSALEGHVQYARQCIADKETAISEREARLENLKKEMERVKRMEGAMVQALVAYDALNEREC